MDNLTKFLEKRKGMLEMIIKKKEQALEKAPEGKLRYIESGKHIKYYCRAKPSERSGKYIKKSDVKFAEALAQKEYDKYVLQKANQELKKITSLLSFYDSGYVETVFESMKEPKRRLIVPVKLTDEQYVEKWMSETYTRKTFAYDAPELLTEKEERVRSKSELIIANTLHGMGIPYHYEVPIKLKGIGVIHPDFKVLNVRERKTYFWEHLGKMDDPKYVEHAINRIYQYEINGYFPGEKLLLTYETQNSPLGTKQIKMIIEKYLL